MPDGEQNVACLEFQLSVWDNEASTALHHDDQCAFGKMQVPQKVTLGKVGFGERHLR